MKLILMFLLLMPATALSERLNTLQIDIVIKALQYNLDPFLVLSIVELESKFNMNARGRHGEVGLFQLRKKFHGGERFLASEDNNIDAGLKYLVEVRKICEEDYGAAWFICFNHGPNYRVKFPKKFAYYKKVMGIYEKYKKRQK